MPLLDAPWILDIDTTVKPLYGKQEGAVVSYNPRKPGRPSHSYHTYLMAGPSKREGCPSRSSLTPPCGTTAVGSSGTTHQTFQAWVMRGRSNG